jgi:two-component system, cell cycle sensor histidine kinase and response regulator CckA
MPEMSSLFPKRTKVVLLVDDDTQFLYLGQELLEYLGFQALIASQGDQALEIFRQRQQEIDLVIMDFNLPRINGYQLLQQLQTIAPQVKVIIASGFFGQAEMDKFIEAGVAGLIHKPFRAQQLQVEILRILGD